MLTKVKTTQLHKGDEMFLNAEAVTVVQTVPEDGMFYASIPGQDIIELAETELDKVTIGMVEVGKSALEDTKDFTFFVHPSCVVKVNERLEKGIIELHLNNDARIKVKNETEEVVAIINKA